MLWGSAAREGRLPSDERLTAAVERMKQSAWEFDAAQCTATFLVDSPTEISFDAIAKGLIIDKVCDVALRVDGVDGVMVNIGGDLRVAGSASQAVSISAPWEPSSTITTFDLRNKSVATSGGYHRFFEVGGRRFSHLIDPRTARPVSHSSSVTVIAGSAAAADAMATALSVFPPQEAIEWCNQDAGFGCLIVDSEGGIHASDRWPQSPRVEPMKVQFVSTSQAAVDWPAGAKLALEFELNRPSTSRYRRPYIAVWIEDEEAAPVRTLILWLQEGRGARWHRDLKRWYKQDSIRKLVDGTGLIGTISAATRPPGKYKSVWDGKDDQGKVVQKGNYTLYLEAAREHGTYQLIRHPLVIGEAGAKGKLSGNTEIKSAAYEYVP